MKLKTNLIVVILCLLFGCATISSDWKETEELGTIEAYQVFIREHPKTPEVLKAKEKVEHLVWINTRKENTESTYRQYIKIYPKGRYVEKTMTQLDNISWDHAVRENSIDSYIKFVNDHSASKYTPEAKAKLDNLYWKIATDEKSIQSFRSYLKANKNGVISGVNKDVAMQQLNDLLRSAIVSDDEMKIIITKLKKLVAPFSLLDIYNQSTSNPFSGSATVMTSDSKIQTNSNPLMSTTIFVSVGESVEVVHSLGKTRHIMLLGFDDESNSKVVAKLTNPLSYTDKNGKSVGFFEQIEFYSRDKTIQSRYLRINNRWYKIN